MAISLKEQLNQAQQITEVIYRAPIFGYNYYQHGNHSKGREQGRRMFYDFYAMELLWSKLGGGAGSKAEQNRVNQAKAKVAAGTATDDDYFYANLDPKYSGISAWHGTSAVAGAVILPHKLQTTVDDLYEQVTRAVSKELLDYVRFAVIQEFQYLISYSDGWSKFRQEIVSHYNSSSTITKQQFDAIVNKRIPEMRPYPSVVKRLLKYSKYFSSMHTIDDKDPFDVTRNLSGKPPVGPSEPEDPFIEPQGHEEDEPISMPGGEEPPPEGEEIPGREFGTQGDVVGNIPPGWPDDKDEDEDEDEKNKLTEQLLTEEEINPKKIKKVMAAMKKADITLDDIEKSYNYIPWGGGYGGPKWGAGALALLKLMEARKTMDVEGLNSIIDHIYDLQHNTGALLNKGPMYVEDEDLNRRYKIRHIARFLPHVSLVVKGIITICLKYLENDPAQAKLEMEKEKIVSSPTKDMTPEQQAFLKEKGFNFVNAGRCRAAINFKNKMGASVSGVYYQITAHADGRFSVNDNLMADIQVFNTFEEVQKFIPHFEADIKKGGVSSSSSSHAAPIKSEKEIYKQSHSRIKLPADKETDLLYQAKMGWRNSQKYKAYFPGSKRFELYAFSDGSFLATYSDSMEFKVFTDWINAFNYCKTEGAKALDYPDKDGALAAIGKGGSGNVVSPSEPVGAPVVPSKPVVTVDYYLEPLEVQSIKQLLSAASFTAIHVIGQDSTGMYNIGTLQNGHLFSVGHKLNTAYGKTYRVAHNLPGGVPETWTFSDWKQTYEFLQKNLQGLIKNIPISSTKSFLSATTPLAYTPTGNDLPAYSPSKASYAMHTGIQTPPKHTIRLTKEDEALVTAAGFIPKMLSGDVWYIHKFAKDTIKFYPNNTAKLLFTSQSSTVPGVNFNNIEKMLVWVQKNYTSTTTKSPLETGVPTAAPVAGGGTQLGSMMEKILISAGFAWNDATKTYEDANKPGAPNTIVIKPNKASVLMVKPNTAYNDEVHHFANLLDLMTYIKDVYPTDKKKSKPAVAPTVAVSPDVAKMTKSDLHEKLFSLGYKTTLKVVSNGVEYLHPSNGSVIILYYDGKSLYISPAATIKYAFNTFQELSDYLDKLYPGGGSMDFSKLPKEPTGGGITNEEYEQLKSLAGKHGYISSWMGSQGQAGVSDHVSIYKKPVDESPPAKYPLVYTVWKYGEYYQINDVNGNPLSLTDGFEKLKQSIEKLLDPKEALITLLELLKQGGFQYVKGPSKNGGYEYANTKNESFQYFPHNKTSTLYDAAVSNMVFFDNLQQAVDYLTKKYGNLTPSPVAKDVEVPFAKVGKITVFPSWATDKLRDLMEKGKFYYKGPTSGGVGYRYDNEAEDWITLYKDGSSEVYDKKHGNSIAYNNLPDLMEYMQEKYGSSPAPEEDVPTKEVPSTIDLLGDLPAALAKGGFKYASPVDSSDDSYSSGSVYDGNDGTRIVFYDSGKSNIYYSNGSSISLNTPNELVQWLIDKYGQPYQSHTEELYARLKQYGYKDYPYSNPQFVTWIHPTSTDRIQVQDDGHVIIDPAVTAEEKGAVSIYLDTPQQLLEYLDKKHGPAKLKLKQIHEELPKLLKEIGFVLEVLPHISLNQVYKHPQGSTFTVHEKNKAYEIHVGSIKVTYQSITDAIYFLNQYFHTGGNNAEASMVTGNTGNTALDAAINNAGFKYHGTAEDTSAMIFYSNDGVQLKIFDDKSSIHNWPQTAMGGKQKVTTFNDFESLTEFLGQLHGRKEPKPEDFPFPQLLAQWEDLSGKLKDYGFTYKTTSKSGNVSYKVYSHVNLVNLTVYADGKSAYMGKASVGGLTFNTFKELESFLDTHYGKKEDYAISYYDNLGPSQTAYSIRLKEEDEKQLKSLGWVWVPSAESSTVSAYVHKDTAKRLVFYNMLLAVNKDKPTAALLDKSFYNLMDFKGKFIPEVIAYFIEHPEKISDANPPGGKYSVHYYDEVGPDQSHYSIRLRKEDEEILEDHGFIWRPAHNSGDPNWYQNTVNETYLMFYNMSLPDNKSGPAAKLTHKYVEPITSWTTIDLTLKWVTDHIASIKGGNYSVHYYNVVGPGQEAKTIRLKKKDEAVLLELGYKWVPSWVQGKPSAYVNIIGGKRIEFYNKNLEQYSGNSSIGVRLKNYEGTKTLNEWIEIENALLSLSLSEGKNKASKQSILTYADANPIINNHLPTVLTADANLYDLITFKEDEKSGQKEMDQSTGEIWVSYEGKLRFAIGKLNVNDCLEPSWYIRQVTGVDKIKLGEEIYTFYTANNAIQYINKYSLQFLTGVPITQSLLLNKKPKGIAGKDLLPLHFAVLGIAAGFSQVGNEQEGVVYTHENGEFSFTWTPTSITWFAGEVGIKEVTPLAPATTTEFIASALENCGPEMNVAELDKVFCSAAQSRKEKIFDRMLKIARKHNGANMEGTRLHKALTDKWFIWNDFDHVYMNERLSQVVVVTLSKNVAYNEYHLYWIKVDGSIAHATPGETLLMAFIGPNGSLKQYHQTFKSAKNLTLTPSGHLYKVHSNEANADRIKVNEHDTELLEKCGFVWNSSFFAYTNLDEDSFSFTNTDKAQYWNAAEFMGYGFDEISQALTFAIQKYITMAVGTGVHPTQAHSKMITTPITAPNKMASEESWGPFSDEAYDKDYPEDEDDVDMIDLNDQDTGELKKLGFEHDPKNHSYVKHIQKGEKPNMKYKFIEAKKKGSDKGKKGKHIAKQFDLPLDDPKHEEPVGELDQYEVIYAFNTGNATWTLTDDPGPGGDETQMEDGTIKEVLTFVWKRWSKIKWSELPSDNVSKKLSEMGFTFTGEVGTAGYTYTKKIGEFTNKVQIYPPDKFIYVVYQTAGGSTAEQVFKYEDTIDGGIKYLQTHVHAPPPKKNPLPKKSKHITTVEDAILNGGGRYMDAPLEWKQYAPYAPVKSPKSTTVYPAQIHNEILNLGFVWSDNLGIYTKNYADVNKWEAVKYEDELAFYFYPATSWDMSRRYFVSKNSTAVLNKIHIIDSWKSEKSKIWGGGTGEVPYSGFDYVNFYHKEQGLPTNMSIQLEPKDEKVMEDMGFNLNHLPATSKSYKYAYVKDAERMFFFAGGGVAPGAAYWTDNTGVQQYFPTVKQAMQFLWDKYAPKKKVTGEMPFSDYPYHNLWKLQNINQHVAIKLVDDDYEVMKSMGFREKFNKGLGPYYQNGIEDITFYADGTAKYWENNTSGNPPTKFPSVKAAMTKLWRKHAPYIEETIGYEDLTDLMMA